MDGKRILVVGASSGVGAAVARLADGQGARTAISARRAEVLTEMARTSTAMIAVPGDVCDEVSARAVVETASAALGGLDAVIYAVGVSPLGPLAEATAAQWHDVLGANLIGAAVVSAAAAPHLLAADGRLIILSSKAVRRPFPDLTLYSTSKLALDGLIRCLPGEFPGLRVTRVVVGDTAGTGFATAWSPEALEAALGRWIAAGLLAEGVGRGGTMTPEDVAASIWHVVTSDAHVDDIAVVGPG